MVTVRRFEAIDYEGVLALDTAEQRAYRGAAWDAASSAEREAFLMTSPRNRDTYAASESCLVAEDDGRIVGFLFALSLLPDVLVVDGVGVARTMRRKGIGGSMYTELL